jgi:hypothetical protein
MRHNSREVTLSFASRDNSTTASNFASFVFGESHYNLQILRHDVCNI